MRAVVIVCVLEGSVLTPTRSLTMISNVYTPTAVVVSRRVCVSVCSNQGSHRVMRRPFYIFLMLLRSFGDTYTEDNDRHTDGRQLTTSRVALTSLKWLKTPPSRRGYRFFFPIRKWIHLHARSCHSCAVEYSLRTRCLRPGQKRVALF